MLVGFLLSFLLAFTSSDLSASISPISINQRSPSFANAETFSLGIKTTAKAVLVADVSAEQPARNATQSVAGGPKMLLAKNSDQIFPIASLTKLMSLLVFLENDGDLSGEVIMKREDESPDEPGAKRINVISGERIKKKDLFFASLISSANNALKALVRSSGLATEEFVDLMNRKAVELGMLNTKFQDSTGLSLENTSAVSDLLILAQAAFKRPEIIEASQKQYYSFKTLRPTGQSLVGINHRLVHTNILLKSFLNTPHANAGVGANTEDFKIIASKTGHLLEAGYNLISKVKKGEQEIIVIVLASETSESRFQETKGLAYWAFTK